MRDGDTQSKNMLKRTHMKSKENERQAKCGGVKKKKEKRGDERGNLGTNNQNHRHTVIKDRQTHIHREKDNTLARKPIGRHYVGVGDPM